MMNKNINMTQQLPTGQFLVPRNLPMPGDHTVRFTPAPPFIIFFSFLDTVLALFCVCVCFVFCMAADT